jgi:hypothetical protein
MATILGDLVEEEKSLARSFPALQKEAYEFMERLQTAKNNMLEDRNSVQVWYKRRAEYPGNAEVARTAAEYRMRYGKSKTEFDAVQEQCDKFRDEKFKPAQDAAKRVENTKYKRQDNRNDVAGGRKEQHGRK